MSATPYSVFEAPVAPVSSHLFQPASFISGSSASIPTAEVGELSSDGSLHSSFYGVDGNPLASVPFTTVPGQLSRLHLSASVVSHDATSGYEIERSAGPYVPEDHHSHVGLGDKLGVERPYRLVAAPPEFSSIASERAELVKLERNSVSEILAGGATLFKELTPVSFKKGCGCL
jgi:hypothetical protein